jgi:DNA-binding MarR family transcriptional regulator
VSTSIKQLQTLQALHNLPDGSLRELGEKLGIKHPTVQASLKRLEREGLVKLKPNRRLTAKGKKALLHAADDLKATLSAVA